MKPERIEEKLRAVELVAREAERQGEAPIEHYVKTAELLHLLRCAQKLARLTARAALDRRVVELLRKLADRPEGYAVAFSEDARALLAELKETPHA